MSIRSNRREEIRELLALKSREGLTYKELSARCGLAASTLAQWAWRLRHEPSSGFAEVVVVDDAPADSAADITSSKGEVLTIQIGDCVIAVPPGTDEPTLARALRAVRAQC